MSTSKRNNSYTVFMAEQRKLITDKNDKISFGEISKQLSDKWKQLSPDQKLVYTNKAKELNAQNKSVKKNKKTSKKKSDVVTIKRPLSAYMFFAKEKSNKIKEQFPKLTFALRGKKMGEMWSGMSDVDKKPYVELSTKDKERFKREIAAGGVVAKRRSKNTEIKRPMSAYMYFSVAKRPELVASHKDAKFGEIGRLLGDAWHQLGGAQKAPFVEQAKKDKERYDEELAKLIKPNADGSLPKCAGTTKKGEPCKNAPIKGSHYCSRHLPSK